jgi:hypothetical protein
VLDPNGQSAEEALLTGLRIIVHGGLAMFFNAIEHDMVVSRSKQTFLLSKFRSRNGLGS